MFCNRLKYLASKRKKLLEASVIGDGIAVAANTSNMILPNDPQQDLEFLKYSTIVDLDDETVKQKLNNTRNSRLDIMKDHQSDLREKFPFFFSHPKLVSFIANILNCIKSKDLLLLSVADRFRGKTWVHDGKRISECMARHF